MPLAQKRKICGFLGASAFLLMCIPAIPKEEKQQPLRVSMVQLIVSPEKYDGKLVSVVGFLAFGFEGDWLSLHKEDYANGILADGVRVDRTKQMLRDIEKLDRNYVLIVGVFRREQSPSGFSSEGHITSVEKCELWSQPDHPRTERFREMQGERPKQNR